jgi:DNA-binding winged helix-turn-helix (wHTH) protein/tetratricopeptide (TPR) repeat protein
MYLTSNSLYRFDEFELDAAKRTFTRSGHRVALTPKAFEVLIFLVANPGRVVTKEELMKAVWPESFVEESNLAQHIKWLRKALEDKAEMIVTIPGRGYQFAAQVEASAIEPEPMVISPEAQPGEVLVQRVRERAHIVVEESFPAPLQADAKTEKKGLDNWISLRSVVLAVGIAALAVVATWMIGTNYWKKAHTGASPAQTAAGTPGIRRRSIAVLGFRNLSGRPEEAWLSTALSEMLSTELAAGEKLRLVSGEDVERTKLELPLAAADSFSRETLARLHRNLDSDLIVLGSYTAVGEKPSTRIRLDLRLQDTSAGETVADVAVMGGEADLFDLVSQAGARLREKLGVEDVSPLEAVSVRASMPANRDAARLYSEGLARLRVFDALEARDLLQQAIAADSRFALAHSALAEAWLRLGYDKKAQAEARQAYDMSANLSREEKLLVEARYRSAQHENEKAIDVYRALFTLFPDTLDYGFKLAAAQARAAKAHDALATIESLRKLTPPASDDPRIDLVEADAWESLNDFKQEEQALARAVEKAKAAGSRLILAGARQTQCWVFGQHTAQIESAVEACREAADIYAGAGDQKGRAVSLSTWADAISDTDAPEAIRLYNRALQIYRSIGFEHGVAGALNNLATVYLDEGEPALSEKMFREALASFRLLDEKNNQAVILGNIAGDREILGDLPGARQLIEEKLQISRETGDTGTAPYVDQYLAEISDLQGDLASAKQGYEQSLGIWQRIGDQNSSVLAMWGLGDLLLQQADFSGSRKMYEKALAAMTSSGEHLSAAKTQRRIADLSLEEALSPVDQEAAVRQALDVFQKQKARDDEIQAWCVLSRALLAEGKAAAAKEVTQHARDLALKSQNVKTQWGTAIAAARAEAAQMDAAHSPSGVAARKELAAVAAKSHQLGYRLVELDARLALAEFEMKAGQTAQGRSHLTAIEAEAKAIGYNLVARKAAVARG